MYYNKGYTFPSDKICISEGLDSVSRVMLVRNGVCKVTEVLCIFHMIFIKYSFLDYAG